MSNDLPAELADSECVDFVAVALGFVLVPAAFAAYDSLAALDHCNKQDSLFVRYNRRDVLDMQETKRKQFINTCVTQAHMQNATKCQ